MNPMSAIKEIEKNLQNYIRRTLPVERALPSFTEPLNELFRNYPLAEAPYLEIIPGYETGGTLQQLVDEGIIYQETADIFAKSFGKETAAEVKLYSHQFRAICDTCREGKNLIVCSGTGSGKTECFLIPLINHLVGEWIAAGSPERWDAPGVRCMVLYPMNALVNDQIRRLRGILQYAPFITFGKYTGELSLKEREVPSELRDYATFFPGENNSGASFDDEESLPNEVTLRSTWHKSPAHILVTNY